MMNMVRLPGATTLTNADEESLSGGDAPLPIDKVVIHGTEFTRVDDRYLLQREVEQALAQSQVGSTPHVQRLTTLLEDIVSAADSVALEVMEAQARDATRSANLSIPTDTAARLLLAEVRDGLREQILTIDTFMQRIEG